MYYALTRLSTLLTDLALSFRVRPPVQCHTPHSHMSRRNNLPNSGAAATGVQGNRTLNMSSGVDAAALLNVRDLLAC